MKKTKKKINKRKCLPIFIKMLQSSACFLLTCITYCLVILVFVCYSLRSWIIATLFNAAYNCWRKPKKPRYFCYQKYKNQLGCILLWCLIKLFRESNSSRMKLYKRSQTLFFIRFIFAFFRAKKSLNDSVIVLQLNNK